MLEAVQTSTHNLCFGAKIRKKCLRPYTPVLLYQSGVQGGNITRIRFPDDQSSIWSFDEYRHLLLSDILL